MTKRVFSGVQPSGSLHIGNYLGAIKRFVELQEHHEVFYCVVDEHAITVPQEPGQLRRDTLDVASTYLAAGLDPKRSTIFVQSHVPAHTELGWIINTFTPMGELERMTQFKEKGKKQRSGVFAGLFNYPTLMAADILLYQTHIVPVGEDQTQHIELTRSIAERFNNRYGKTFEIPEALVKKETAKILSLTNPAEKMSKSDPSDKSRINLTDSSDLIREKIKSAVTDSDKEIRFDPRAKSAISNLLVIFSEFSRHSIQELEEAYRGKSYVQFKSDLAEAVVAGLSPIQEKLRELRSDEATIREILAAGSKHASTIAEKTLADVKQKIGFLSL
jgi:tryptophanyl-tRNA synthetase